MDYLEWKSNVFSLFQNAECYTSESSGSEYGTCYTPSECTDLGGTGFGTCAEGYGVCCICKSSQYTHTHILCMTV